MTSWQSDNSSMNGALNCSQATRLSKTNSYTATYVPSPTQVLLDSFNQHQPQPALNVSPRTLTQ